MEDYNPEWNEVEEDDIIEINLDNIHDLVEAIHQDTPNFPVGQIYRFLVSREFMDKEISIKELVDRFNGFVQERVNKLLDEMVKDGEVEVYFDDKTNDIVFSPVPKDLFKKDKEQS